MPNFMLLATAWGPKYGGINAFNMDFASGLADHLGASGKVFCAVLSPSREDVEGAKLRGVHLLPIERPANSLAYDRSWALDVWQKLEKDAPGEAVDWWVGHDVTTGWAAVEGPTVAGHGRSALIMHMNYADYQSYKGGVGERAAEKERDQRRLFSKADRCFANGPLLRDALREIVADATMLIPGFADVPVRPSSHRLHVITFGRMDRESDRIKQGGLAVAGFASAIRHAWDHAGLPEKLKDNPQMRIIGISEPGGNEEQTLRALADQKADRIVNLIPLRFDEHRDQLFDELGRANISLMLSWHEGFGLTGWEAVAGEIPLIISRQTGLWQLLKETFGERPAQGYVRVVDVRGQEGDDDISNFRPDDEATIRDAIIECTASLEEARKAAAKLKSDLKKVWICTWENTAKQFYFGLGVEPSEVIAKPNEDTAESGSIPASRSAFVVIPKTNWPADIGIEMPDSMMLRPESRVVRFHRLREPLRETIVDWALDPDEPIKLRLQAGEGGSGKTRLLIEVCDKLAHAHGWRAGFVDKAQSVESGFSALLAEGKPSLVVLDYAESRTGEVVELVRTALGSKNVPLVRFVLLAREGGDWWDRLAGAAGDDHAVAAMLRGVNTKTGPYRMAKECIEIGDRYALFQDALQDFARRKKLPVPVVSEPDLSSDFFRNPLFIHLSALAHVKGQPSVDDQELLSMALGHERSFWRRLLGSAAFPDDVLPALEQAVALLTLSNGGRSAKRAKHLLAHTPRLRDLPSAMRTSLFDLMRRIYPLEGGLVGLQPDLLGETLISEALALDDELLDVVLGEESDQEERRYALTVLTRLARRVPKEGRWLKRALERNLIDISEDALTVGVETGSPMPEIHAEVLRTAGRRERRQAIDKLRPKLPKETFNLASLNVEIMRQAVAFLDDKKSGSPDKRHIALCDALSSLATAARTKGLLAEAANNASEAARHASLVFRSDTDQDRRRLASVFMNSANHLSEVGRLEESLKLAEQAESLWRRLAEKQPDAYTAQWATSLANLGSHLGGVGRFEDGLRVAEQAEGLRRRFAKKHPDAYTADWAASLNNLANRLNNVGRFEEALKAAEQAESLWRGFEEKQPDAHTASWATSLANLGTHLSGVGRFEEGLRVAEQAESLWRRFAEKQPDAYTADWATSLNNLGSHLSEVGRFEEALKAAEQAERLRRELAEKQPDAYTVDWATSLSNLGSHLSEVGRFEEALKAAEQAERLRRELAEKQPDAYTADWATSLSNLGGHLSEVGRFEEGLKAAEQAESLQRGLAEKQPDAYTADWATSLANLGSLLSAVGRFEEGLKAAERAESLRRRLAEKQPDAYTADWATSLANLGSHLRDVGRFEDGLKATEQAESLRRGLAEKQPDAYTSDWATSLANLADSRVAVGRFSQGLDTAKAAFQHIWPFVERYPRVYRPWLGFAHRAAADSLFKMERFTEAADEARQSADIWIESAKERQNFESRQIAETFRTLMKCEIALGRNEAAISALAQAFLLLRRPLEVNPRPLQSLLLELIAIAERLDRDAVVRAIPNELLAIIRPER